MTERAAEAIGLDLEWARSRAGQRRVVVGIVDLGFDGAHPGFGGRILRAWDQTSPGVRSVSGIQGREWTAEPYDALTDDVGHGTHTAGIIAELNPHAELVLVKSPLTEDSVAAAMQYVFQCADQIDAPAVVNLSLGLEHVDAHDGRDPLSAAVDDLVGPGRLVCCAVGNDVRSAPLHVGGSLDPGGAATVGWLLLPRDMLTDGLAAFPRAEATFWYEPEAGDVTVTVADSSGSVRLDAGAQDEVSGTLGPYAVTILCGIDPLTELAKITVLARPGRGHPALAGGALLVGMEGTGLVSPARVDGWVRNGRTFFQAHHGWDEVDDLCVMRAPSSAHGAIAVGASASRDSWTAVVDPPDIGLVVGDVAPFSNPGPTRDGRERPDVLAPGAPIYSWMAAGAPLDGIYRSPDGRAVMLGTSQAAAVTSAILASLLERDPTLTPDAARGLLRDSASLGRFDPRRGYGVVQAGNLGFRP